MDEILLGVFVLTQVGDFVTTKIALDKGGSEANDLVKIAIDKFGIFGLALWKFWASGLMIWTYFSGATGDVFPILAGLLIVFYAVILHNNISVIRVLNERTRSAG